MEPLRPTPLDLAIIRRAESQGGLLRRADLLELGLGGEALKYRRRSGSLHQLHPGVYALGHRAVTRRAEYLAAVWWCGDRSALSHASAAAFKRWVVEDPDHPPPVHVTTLRDRSGRPGVIVHRSRRLDIKDVTRWGRLWVTDDARTLIDLADIVPYGRLREIADQLAFLPTARLEATLERNPGRRGAPSVRRLIRSEDAHTRSALERRSVAYFAAHGVPEPAGRNVKVHGIRVDCWYPDALLVLELDSRAHHTRRREVEQDRHRDRALLRHDITTLRFLWHDLDPADPLAAQDVRRRLARGPLQA